MRKLVSGVVAVLMTCTGADAQEAAVEFVVVRTDAAPREVVDNESPWWDAHRVRWGPPQHETEFRALWSDEGLYVRFEATDGNPWFTMMKRDDPIWEEEVVEIFLDLDRSGTNYAEVEISPANVVTDVRMIQASPDKQMDLSWNLEGLETHVRVNRFRDGRTAGWTAVAFLPWTGFATLPSAEGLSLPPLPNDRWRFNVFRIKRPGGERRPNQDVIFSAWSPPSGDSFHEPDVFCDLVFHQTTNHY